MNRDQTLAVQRMLGVPADGVYGPRTHLALLEAISVRGAAPGEDPILIAELRRDEGVVPHAYQDHLGYWTIGVGRLIDKRKGGRLTDAEINLLLANDIAACRSDLADLPAWRAVQDDPVRARALINMRFQLGGAGLRGFTNSLAMIERRDWAAAGANLRNSLWYRQTPTRAERVIRMIETGRA
ncbi:glycoside hydrolase family protein [Coralloluteibacterium thermophilus]|uniref:Lysozyme n=1 Tax=Coralloluteibacterium thermophilum TaxID=2707049 RepID=A0ABV9NG53_9GAMM